jgi:hypothetical protein
MSMNVKSFLDYYFSGWTDILKSTRHHMYDGFGPGLGIVAILLITHMSACWLYVLFFYNVILARIDKRVRAFCKDVREVGF